LDSKIEFLIYYTTASLGPGWVMWVSKNVKTNERELVMHCQHQPSLRVYTSSLGTVTVPRTGKASDDVKARGLQNS
jgi:hypothetical protein